MSISSVILLWCHYCMCMLRGPVGRLGHGLNPLPPPSLSLSLSLSLSDRLVGLGVKVSASRTEDPGSESRLRRDFSGVDSYQ